MKPRTAARSLLRLRFLLPTFYFLLCASANAANPTLSLYCDLDNQVFVTSLTSAQQPSISFTQNNDVVINLYLVRPDPDSSGSARTFEYDALSGASGHTVSVALANPANTSNVTLAIQSTWTTITNGFTATFRTTTAELATFLQGKPSRNAVFQVQITDGSANVLSHFQAPVVVRANAVSGITPITLSLTDPGADRIVFWDDSASAFAFLSLGTGLSITTTTMSLATNLSQIGALTDPNADRLLFWDDSAGAYTHLTVGSGLTITDTTISASGGGTVTAVTVTTANGVSASVANQGTTPAFTFTLGAITPSSVNGLSITSSTGTLTIANGKTATFSNTLTLAGTDGSSLNIGTGGTLGSAAFVATGTTSGTVPLLGTGGRLDVARMPSDAGGEEVYLGGSNQFLNLPDFINSVVVGVYVRHTEVDTAAEINALTTDADFLTDAPSTQLYVYDDFIEQTIKMFTGGTTGGTAPATLNGDAGRPGLKTLSTSTSTTGASYIWDANPVMWAFSGGEAVYETSLRVVTLSDGTETFTVRAGWNDSSPPTADGADGVYFRYTHSENSGRWVLVARNNSVETVANSNVAVPANGWDRLRIVVNAAGTSAEGFVDGVSIGTVASNIPTSGVRATGMQTSIVKSAGTTARTMTVDYIMVKQSFTTAR